MVNEKGEVMTGAKRLELTDNARGTTLVELMVYISIMGIIFSIVYTILTYSMRYFDYGINLADLQQQALKAQMKLSQEISESTMSSVIYNNDSVNGYGIIFLSPRDNRGNFKTYQNLDAGKPIWQKFIGYYVSSDKLMRKEVNITPAPNPAPAAPVPVPANPYTSVADFLSKTSSAQPRCISSSVYSMRFDNFQNTAFSIYGTFRLTYKGKINEIQLNTQDLKPITACPRN